MRCKVGVNRVLSEAGQRVHPCCRIGWAVMAGEDSISLVPLSGMVGQGCDGWSPRRSLQVGLSAARYQYETVKRRGGCWGRLGVGRAWDAAFRCFGDGNGLTQGRLFGLIVAFSASPYICDPCRKWTNPLRRGTSGGCWGLFAKGTMAQ